MTATGNITEDARAIQELIAPGSRTTLGHHGPWPWVPRADEIDISIARSQYEFFDEQVVELLWVTEQFTAGYFVNRESLRAHLHASPKVSDLAYALSNEVVGELLFEPTGDILWFCKASGQSVGVEMGGPNHGRLLAPPWHLGFEWRTLAWSLSDAVACTRELYEAGWFQWERNPFHYPDYWTESALPQEEMYPTLAPIIDRWNCSPLIAEFDETYHREPEHPTRHR